MESVPLRRVVHTADDFGEELAIQIRKKDADRVGLAGDEAAGATVGNVPHPAGDLVNETPGVFAHRSTVVEHSGDSSNGDLCFTGDILDGDQASPGVTGRWLVEQRKYVIVYIEGAS